jgi:D-lactate dehydrogenase
MTSGAAADATRDGLAALRAALPKSRLLSDPADRLSYGYDNSRRLAMPDAVLLAQSHEEVATLIGVCHQYQMPVIARGRGTNTTGATVPTQGGVVVSFENMNRILEYSPGDRLMVCEAGTLNGDVQTRAAADGLFWAPDPTSAAYSTIGGNLACGAGGPGAVKYGTARDSVLGLRAVDGTGRSLRTGCRTTKGVVGYDISRLLIGSEGTLALITEATLRLLPRPSERRTLRASYRDVAAAAAAVARIMGQATLPCALEFMDGDAVALASQHADIGIPAGTGALLLMAADGDADSIASSCRALEAAAAGEGLIDILTAGNAEEAEQVWAARKALSPALRKLAPKKVNEDVAVPVTRLSDLVTGLGRLSRVHGLRIVSFGHAGNGNLHVNLLADPDDPAQMQAIGACLSEVFDLVLELGGTLSGEHGIGLDKRDFVAREIDAETLALMHSLRQVFDPSGILNPGKALP